MIICFWKLKIFFLVKTWGTGIVWGFFQILMKPQNWSCINTTNQYFSKAKHTKFRTCSSREICHSFPWIFVLIQVNSHYLGFSSVNIHLMTKQASCLCQFYGHNHNILINSIIIFLVLSG